MKKVPTTVDRKAWKKWLICPTLALLLVLSSLPVYADEQKTEVTETPTVTQETGSESAAESAASSEQDELITDELEPIPPIDSQENDMVATSDWTQEEPHEGQVLHGGYVGFKNKASGKYLTIPNGATTADTNVCQQSESAVANSQEFYLTFSYNTTRNVSFFYISPLTSTGANSGQHIKWEALDTNANVNIDTYLPTQTNDRWQIEHVEGNYYRIYAGQNPDATGDVKYALTAYGNSDGTSGGTSPTSPGNVYLSVYTGADNQLWQICANGIAMFLENSVDISSEAPVLDIQKGSLAYSYYVPKRFNDSITWRASNTVRGIVNAHGGCYGVYAGAVDLIANVTHADGSVDEYTCNCYVYLPSGAYSVSSSNALYLDTQDNYANAGSYMVFKESEDFCEENRTQLFRFAYVGGGQYLISSMVYHDNHLSIESNSGNVLIGATSGSSQGLKWVLDENYSGCIIKISEGANWCWTMDSSSGDTPTLKYASYANASNQRWNINREFESMIGVEYIDPLDCVVLHNYRALEVITYSTTLDDINVTWSSLDLNTFFQDDTASLVQGRGVGEARVRATVSNSSMQTQKDFSIWVIPAFDGYYSVKNCGSGESIYTDSYLEGAQQEANSSCQTLQTGWYLEYAFEGYYRIKSAYNGLYLNATSYSVSQTSQSLLSTYWRFVEAEGSSSDDPHYNMVNLSEQLEGKVLAVSFDSNTSVIMDDETNINYYLDEWNLIPWGRDAYMLGILDRTVGHDHDSVFYEIQDELNMLGYTYQTIRSADYMFLEDVEAVLSSVKFFAFRGHGLSMSDKTGISIGSNSVYSTSIYDFGNEEPILDMSECDIALFIGCETGNHDTQSLPDAAVKAGADCAIGFTTTIGCGNANTWLEEFISYYVAANGDVDAALVGMSDAGVALSNVVKKVG
ncbi:MAG: RICIN domain-containing protein [Clostridia bacterium]|nr:RICIN domain-containing protein [Clostridia bacterium]